MYKIVSKYFKKQQIYLADSKKDLPLHTLLKRVELSHGVMVALQFLVLSV